MHLRPTFLITFSLSLVLVSVVVGMLALVLSHDRAVDAEGNFFQTGVDAARIAHITKGDVLTQTVSVHRRHIREIDVLLPERLEGQVTVIQTSTDVVVPFTTSWREEAGRSWMILTFAEEAQYEPGTYKVRVEPISNTAVEVSHPISYRAGEMHINNESGNGNLFFVARYAPRLQSEYYYGNVCIHPFRLFQCMC